MTRQRATALVCSALPALLLFDSVREAQESRMAAHMLVLVMTGAAGWVGAAAFVVKRGTLFAGLDAHGLLGLTFASCALAFWMSPLTLDLSLLEPLVASAKYATVWLSGFALALGLREAPPETLAFFAGNATMMFAAAGVLYMESPTRLCLSYRMDDQVWGGAVLVALGLATSVAAWAALLRSLNRLAPVP